MTAEEALALDGAKYGTSPGLVSKVRKMREDVASLCQALKGGRRALLEHCRRLEQDYIERGMPTEASLLLSLRSGLMEMTRDPPSTKKHNRTSFPGYPCQMSPFSGHATLRKQGRGGGGAGARPGERGS